MPSVMLAAILALTVAQSPPPAPGKVAKPVNDPVSVRGCVRGRLLRIIETDASSLRGLREVRIFGGRALLKQLADYEDRYIEVFGQTVQKGGKPDRLEMNKRQKAGSKTTIQIGAKTEQARGQSLPAIVELEVQGFEPLGDGCPAAF